VRKVERRGGTIGKSWHPHTDDLGLGQHGSNRGENSSKAGWERGDYRVTTLGFFSSCSCHAPTRPAVVLDPFAGSGTVGLVARELGHDAVLCDLSWPYLHTIARERLGLAALDRWINGDTPRVTSYADLPLFGEDRP
jgi:hypothetical protein